ncbi:MAG: biotin/lipoate A/B protein ligase family protein [Nitrososphaerota archaeon]|nr:lipoate--protein ligase family protein [Candidatus Bathyarchaeota archaeon]MDW8048112.1 biotin/lipoate A/B protein ligase family protein [Nitrososphaerota archaeon]
MADSWRLLDTGLNDAFTNMALDEAIAIARSMNRVPNTVRFFRWEPPAVSIGYFQSMEEEVNIAACDERGINYVRRRTGGGAVYHDRDGELTYSIIVNEDHRLISGDFIKTYETLCSGLTAGLRLLGIPAEFKPINDIVVQGKKISGNAQTRSMNVVHQHGTILRDVDPKLMFTVLRVPSEKIRDKMIKAVEERVTSVNGFLGRDVSFEELKRALINGFESSLGIRLIEGEVSDFEWQLACKLRSDKYATREWNFKR